MAKAAREDEKVPDGVHPFDRFPCVENRSDGIAKATRRQENETGGGKLAIERLDGNKAEPAMKR